MLAPLEISRLIRPQPVKQTFIIDRRKFTARTENWGTVFYDFERDLFSAQTHSTLPIFPEAPLGLYWLVTAPCNLRCIHCYGNVEELPQKATTSAQQLQIADKIIASGAMRVTLNGGEPLLRKDTPQIIEHLADADIAVTLGTNGTFLKPEILSSLKRTNRIEISLDSHDEETNNGIRISRTSGGNAFKEALTAIELCVVNNLNLRVLTCLNTRNFNHLESIADLLYSRGVRDWSVSWTLHAGRARHIYSTLVSPTMNSAEDILERIRQKYSDMRIKSSNRSDVALGNNRFSCLVFPDGRMFAEDLQNGQKVGFKSLLESDVSQSWTEENYNIGQHFKRWVGPRIEFVPAKGAVSC